MFAKKIVSVVATVLVGLTMVVGCSKTNGDTSTAAPEEGMAESADGLLGALKQSAPPKTVQKGTVNCSGDQNKPGGRVCCDDTHCCTNYGGKIDCSFGPRQARQ